MLGLANMTVEELEAVQAEIIRMKDELLRDKKRAQKQRAKEFNEFLTANRDVVMQLVKHKEDCDHENGFLSDDRDKYCPACHLREILDGEWLLHAFEVKFTVEITEIED